MTGLTTGLLVGAALLQAAAFVAFWLEWRRWTDHNAAARATADRIEQTYRETVETLTEAHERALDRLQARSLGEYKAATEPRPVPVPAEAVDPDWDNPSFARPDAPRDTEE